MKSDLEKENIALKEKIYELSDESYALRGIILDLENSINNIKKEYTARRTLIDLAMEDLREAHNRNDALIDDKLIKMIKTNYLKVFKEDE